jgi:hypothetical protein
VRWIEQVRATPVTFSSESTSVYILTMPLCSSEGCTNYVVKGGVCWRHGAEVKVCKSAGCTQRAQNGGVCKRHGAKVGQRSNCAALKDAEIKLRREESVRDMVIDEKRIFYFRRL